MSDIDTSASRDFDKPSKEIALEQIYRATGYKAPPAKVTLGQASVLDQFPTVASDENSFVPFDIDPLEDSRFVGDNGFIYRRLSLSEVSPNADIPSVPLSYPFTTHSALALLNSLMGTQLDTSDVENDTYTSSATPVVLRAKPNSVAWVGTKTLAPVNPSHQFLVPNPFLTGFVEYVAEEPLPDPLEPYEGLSRDRLVALINKNLDFGDQIVYGVDFTFGKITTIYTPEYNTRVRLKPTNSGAFVEQDIFYNRLDIDALSRLPAGTIQPVDVSLPFTIHGVLPAINAALGLDLLASEVFDATHTQAQATYTLQVRSNQYAWMPSSYEFTPNILVINVGRQLEDGSARTMEDGSPREMENGL